MTKKIHNTKAMCGTCPYFHAVEGSTVAGKFCHGVKGLVRIMYSPEFCKRHPDYYAKDRAQQDRLVQVLDVAPDLFTNMDGTPDDEGWEAHLRRCGALGRCNGE